MAERQQILESLPSKVWHESKAKSIPLKLVFEGEYIFTSSEGGPWSDDMKQPSIACMPLDPTILEFNSTGVNSVKLQTSSNLD